MNNVLNNCVNFISINFPDPGSLGEYIPRLLEVIRCSKINVEYEVIPEQLKIKFVEAESREDIFDFSETLYLNLSSFCFSKAIKVHSNELNSRRILWGRVDGNHLKMLAELTGGYINGVPTVV